MELVERTALMAQLDGFLAEARTGSGCVVLLGGEAGVGKTSLARAFVTGDAASLRVLWGACERLVTPEPSGRSMTWRPSRRSSLPDRAASSY